MKLITCAVRGSIALLAGAMGCALFAGFWFTGMPGSSHAGPLPEPAPEQRELAKRLEQDVSMLSETIGARNMMRPDALNRAAQYLEEAFREAGFDDVRRQSFDVQGVTCHNLEVEITGSTHPDEVVVIGAHYDSAYDAPGANDNASGVAGTLALARLFHGSKPARTLRFVLFTNEEPPFFQTDHMGSLVYARRSEERGEHIVAMISLETIGYFDSTEGSQKYPVGLLEWVYPTRGDFITFVGNVGSRDLVRDSIKVFRKHATIPSEGAVMPELVQGVGWSDHWAFWQAGFPALMVTDTAPFRYPHYHTPQDTSDKLDYTRMAFIVEGMEFVVSELSRR